MSSAASENPAAGRGLLTVQDLAARLGLDVKSVYAGLSRGEIPARRIGRRWIIVEPVIEQWLATAPEPLPRSSWSQPSPRPIRRPNGRVR